MSNAKASSYNIFAKIGNILSGLKVIDRYIGGQVLFSTLFAVVVLSVVLVIGQVFKALLKALESYDVSIFFIIKFILEALPSSLIMTAPWGFLTAVLLVFGRLSADNELVSLRMAGMSMLRICSAVIFISASLAIFCYWLNASIAPLSQQRIANMLVELVRNDPMAFFSPGESSDKIPNHVIYVKEREENTLHDVFLVQANDRHLPGEKKVSKQVPKIFLQAREARVENNPMAKNIIMRFKNVHFIDAGNAYPENLDGATHGVKAGEHAISISTEELINAKKKFKPNMLTNSELREIINDKNSKKELGQKFVNALKFEKSRRLALSFAAITFVLVGIPLGVTTQRRETSVGFILSLVISLIYFFFMIMAGWLNERGGFLAYFLLWLPNLLFIGLGGFLFFRLSKK